MPKDGKISLRVSSEHLRLLEDRADRLGLNPSTLVRVVLVDYLAGSGGLPRREAHPAARAVA
jgi:hypothetical protein